PGQKAAEEVECEGKRTAVSPETCLEDPGKNDREDNDHYSRGNYRPRPTTQRTLVTVGKVSANKRSDKA
ncbi:MAG TPA: hypothetical protein VIJ87_20325, partial [Pyrinomonadaceae bacterium]